MGNYDAGLPYPSKMCGRCYEEVDELYPANCREKPEKLKGQPIGQYHCPDCGAMVLAGVTHPPLCRKCIDRMHPGFDEIGKNWTPISYGLPDEGKPFVVFCPSLSKNPAECVKKGVHTTHNRGVGIRPEGERFYYFHNGVIHWKYIDLPIYLIDPDGCKDYEECICYQCTALNEYEDRPDCACDMVGPSPEAKTCGNCPKKLFCDGAINPDDYKED